MNFIDASLLQLHVGLDAEDGSDLRLLHKLVHINFIQRVRPHDNVLKLATFVQLVEEEALEERAVRLLDGAIDNIDVVLYLPVARGRRFLIADFALVHLGVAQHNTPLRLPLHYLLIKVALHALDVRILEANGATLQILPFAVSVSIPHIDLAFPKWDRAAVLRGEPIIRSSKPVHPDGFHSRLLTRHQDHLVTWLVQWVMHRESDNVLFPAVIELAVLDLLVRVHIGNQVAHTFQCKLVADLGQRIQIGDPVDTFLPRDDFLVFEEDVFVFEVRLADEDWLNRFPNMSFRPLKMALVLNPEAKLFEVADNGYRLADDCLIENGKVERVYALTNFLLCDRWFCRSSCRSWSRGDQGGMGFLICYHRLWLGRWRSCSFFQCLWHVDRICILQAAANIREYLVIEVMLVHFDIRHLVRHFVRTFLLG